MLGARETWPPAIRIARRASALLGEELQASRVLFADIELDENEVVFHSNFTDGSIPVLKGLFAVSDFGKTLFDKLKAGRTSFLHDIAVQMADEPDTVRNFQQVQTNAEIGVPILRDGRLRSILIVNQRGARVWAPHEIALAEDVAERTWNVVEHARAENALRSANRKLEALLNLAINARDAMPDGGALRIRAEDALRGELPQVRICAIDNGAGMPPDVAARVFEPFFTTKPIGEGTGLGLSMVYGFVSQSGGEVRLTSAPGQGTTVSIDLPQYHGTAAQDEGLAPPLDALPHARRATLLLVDDEEPLRAILAELLRDAGHEVLEAASAAAALDQADGRKIDALITDVGLPGGMNGRQLADAVRDRHPGVEVLFVTGYAESTVLNKGALAPGMHIMTKPFALTDFSGRVARMVAAST